MKKKVYEFDIYKFLEERPLSWSGLSSFEYDPDKWFRSYILGERGSSKEMEFGSYVDKRIQTDPAFLPALPRYENMQYKMRTIYKASNGKKIHLIGIPDGLALLSAKILADYKTGKNKWDKKRTDETGQLTFYLLLLRLTENHKPEDFKCLIHWLPTELKKDGSIGFIDDIDNNIRSIETKRTMADVLKFCKRIENVVESMQQYVRSRHG